MDPCIIHLNDLQPEKLPELELPDTKYTPEPWPEPAHWVELKHDLKFPDDMGQTEPAANCPYRLTLANGSLINGTLESVESSQERRPRAT